HANLRLTPKLKNLNFGGISRRVNQSGASLLLWWQPRPESLIQPTLGHPELYDTSSYFYRGDRNKKDLAWKSVSEDIGQPGNCNTHFTFESRDVYRPVSFIFPIVRLPNTNW
ncbi:MAG: hypothetical protein ACRCVV_17600, partial [Shewanella sp.]